MDQTGATRDERPSPWRCSGTRRPHASPTLRASDFTGRQAAPDPRADRAGPGRAGAQGRDRRAHLGRPAAAALAGDAGELRRAAAPGAPAGRAGPGDGAVHDAGRVPPRHRARAARPARLRRAHPPRRRRRTATTPCRCGSSAVAIADGTLLATEPYAAWAVDARRAHERVLHARRGHGRRDRADAADLPSAQFPRPPGDRARPAGRARLAAAHPRGARRRTPRRGRPRLPHLPGRPAPRPRPRAGRRAPGSCWPVCSPVSSPPGMGTPGPGSASSITGVA